MHHQVHINDAPSRAFDPDNCLTLCRRCHLDVTERERGGAGAKFAKRQAAYFEFAGLPEGD